MRGREKRGKGSYDPSCDLETAGNRFSHGTRIEVGIGSLDGNRNLVSEDAVGVRREWEEGVSARE